MGALRVELRRALLGGDTLGLGEARPVRNPPAM
jgi:hypothetical protein